MGKNIGKNVSEILRSKYNPCMSATRQELLDHAKQSATDAIKTTSKRAIQKPAESTGVLIGSEIANRITKVSRYLPQNYSETITNEHDKEIPKD